MEHLERQGFLSLLLSHHTVDQWHLCYRFKVRGKEWALCSRCLGIFPALALTLIIGQLSGPWPGWAEWVVLIFPPLPAVLDWATSAAAGKPPRGNRIRLITGVGLGVGIGGALHVNSYALLNGPVAAQFLYIVAAVLVVRITVFVRFGIERRRKVKQRLRDRPTLEEFIRRSFDPDKGPGGDQRQ